MGGFGDNCISWLRAAKYLLGI